MTKDNKIKWNLQQIADAARGKTFCSSTQETVYYIRYVLDHVEELLEEPEPEACNALEEENRKLKQDLASRNQQLAQVHNQLKEALQYLKDNSE